jgi:hypothetical protein
MPLNLTADYNKDVSFYLIINRPILLSGIEEWLFQKK